jgi:hypothetical protein
VNLIPVVKYRPAEYGSAVLLVFGHACLNMRYTVGAEISGEKWTGLMTLRPEQIAICHHQRRAWLTSASTVTGL